MPSKGDSVLKSSNRDPQPKGRGSLIFAQDSLLGPQSSHTRLGLHAIALSTRRGTVYPRDESRGFFAQNKISAIILAAGLGKRIQSDIPKVLHLIAGEPLIIKSLKVLESINFDQIVIVIGHKGEMVKLALKDKKVDFALQKNQLGTADAARSGLSQVHPQTEIVIVLNGDDSAFYKPQTLEKLINFHLKNNNTLTSLSVELENPAGLGRIIRKNGRLVGIIEEKDASADQKRIKEINCGLYVFNRRWLELNINKIEKSKVTGEYYIVDLIPKAISQKEKIGILKLNNPNEWFGVNTPQDLEKANTKAEIANEKIHFMGISGSGESAAAALSLRYGFVVSGCDINPNSSYTKNLNIKITKGHDINHLKGITKLVISPAVSLLNPNNRELLFAHKNKIPILTWQEFQGKFLQKDKFVIAVAGGYGKSTTTALISKILDDSGSDPTCVVGAKLIDWDKNFRFGNSKYYVCEADEYNNNFLNYHPDIAVILNVAWDHPDFFKDKNSVVNSYKKFINNIKPRGALVLNDQEELNKLAKYARKDIKIIKVKDFGKLKLSIIGDFRKENTDAALTVAQLLKIDPYKAKKSVEQFSGLERRLEYKGKVANCKVYDDYAVQPYTILKTASALKQKFPKSRIVLVFEPHTYSRIETFFDEFINSLNKVNVDEILITDVFAAREKGYNSKLAQKLAKSMKFGSRYTGSIEETAQYLKKNLSKYDIVLSMGAGNIYKLYDLMSEKK